MKLFVVSGKHRSCSTCESRVNFVFISRFGYNVQITPKKVVKRGRKPKDTSVDGFCRLYKCSLSLKYGSTSNNHGKIYWQSQHVKVAKKQFCLSCKTVGNIAYRIDSSQFWLVKMIHHIHVSMVCDSSNTNKVTLSCEETLACAIKSSHTSLQSHTPSDTFLQLFLSIRLLVARV